MSAKDMGELCFEVGFPDTQPADLWRVDSLRHPVTGSEEFQKRAIRHVNWFVTEEAARHYGAWIEGSDGIVRGKVLAITHYRKVE